MTNDDSNDTRPEEVQDIRGPLRELRKYSLGDLDTSHNDVHPAAGLVEDEELRKLLAFFESVYQPVDDMPASFWETEFAQRVIRREASETAAKAVAEGDPNRAAYLTGMPGYSADINGVHAIEELSRWLVDVDNCKLIYMAALMGNGKTDFSALMMELVDHHFERLRTSSHVEDVPTVEFAANFELKPSRDGVSVESINDFDELIEWAKRGSSKEHRWYIFDEASTELTAQSGQNAQQVAELFAPFVKKMRKMGVNLIVIGHDSGDVHPAIREIAYYVDKPNLKTASFYSGISSREPTGHLFDVSGIPQTSWQYDTDDTAAWSWGSALEQGIDLDGDGGAAAATSSAPEPDLDHLRDLRDDRIQRLYHTTELSQADLAAEYDVEDPQTRAEELFNLSKSSIQNITSKVAPVRQDDGTVELVDREEAARRQGVAD